jgi:hypothetical protein
VTKAQTAGVGSVGSEFREAVLGDERLRKRLTRVAEALLRAPSDSFPKAAGSAGQLEAIYRFLGNERVEWTDVLAPHFGETAKRADGLAEVLVVHDGSELRFDSEAADLGYLPQAGRGVLGHFSLCVKLTEYASPLGLVNLEVLSRAEPKKKRTAAEKTKERESRARKDRESAVWGVAARAAEATLKDTGARVVHVMDQEADDFSLFSELVEADSSFVIRGTSGRLLAKDLPLQNVLERAGTAFFRDVPLSRRAKPKGSRPQKTHSERQGRRAELHVRTAQVSLPRPRRAEADARQLFLNVVQVYEPSPPEGETAVQWTLITNLDIHSDAAVEHVVDVYRARWLIEEFFKALKTGCAIEKRQLETAHSLLNALAIFSVVAWRLLALRTLSRCAPETSADEIFTEDNFALMRGLAKRHPSAKLPPGRVTMRDFLMAIAGLGGFLKSNGVPGWQVLGRGYEDFLQAEVGYALGKAQALAEM